MRIVHVSDFHTNANDLAIELDRYGVDPAWPDVVVATGDMIQHFNPTPWAMACEKEDQRAEWLRMVDVLQTAFPSTPIVAVPGNHDFCDLTVDGEVWSFDSPEPTVLDFGRNGKFLGFGGIPYIRGRWRDELGDRARDVILDTMVEMAGDVFVLITHAPPYRVLDRMAIGKHVGWDGMAEAIDQTQIRYHFFGHIHESHGSLVRNNTTHFNSATILQKVVTVTKP